MKPRLTHYGGAWLCVGDGIRGIGWSVTDAYTRWYRRMIEQDYYLNFT
jgi:hypothetical protein